MKLIFPFVILCILFVILCIRAAVLDNASDISLLSPTNILIASLLWSSADSNMSSQMH